MSQSHRMTVSAAVPSWLGALLGAGLLEEGDVTEVRGQRLIVMNGIPRSQKLTSSAQAQTCKAFAFKWKKRDTFDSDASLARMRAWLVERYGDVAAASWWSEYGDQPVLLDAGCGAGLSALELWGTSIPKVRYLGVDSSEAVDVARERFAERSLPGAFLQADIIELPLPDASVDLVFSEGVLHHTPSTEAAL